MTLSKRELDQLIITHRRVILALAHQFAERNTWMDADDLRSQAMLYAVEVAPEYDPALASFSTFVTQRLKWKLSKYVRGQKSRINPGARSGVDISTIADDLDIEAALDERRFAEKASQKPVLRRRLIGHTLEEIGSETGVERSTVLRRQAREIREILGKVDAT